MATLDKALSLLGLFDHKQSEFGLSDLARAAGFGKATTLRLARSLVASGLLEQDTHSKRYRLGAEILRLANLREGLYPLRTIAQPVADTLCSQLGETVHVAARSGDKLGTVLSVEPSRAVRVVVEPGLTLPWHSTASGLALLSALPANQCKLLVATSAGADGLGTEALDALLSTAKASRFAVSRDRFEAGVAGIAAVFFDDRHQAVGTIAVAVSSDSLPDSQIPTLGAAVIEAADRISRQLGASPNFVTKATKVEPAA